ncbi:hypothetical protein ACFL2V_09300 [Pseudomonadota bacterium]
MAKKRRSESPSRREITAPQRREKPSNDLKRIGVAIAALIGTVLAAQHCDLDGDKKAEKREIPVEVKPADAPVEEQEKEVLSRADIPSYKRINSSVSFSQPKDLEMNKEEFLKATKAVAKIIHKETMQRLASSLKEDDGNLEDVIVKYLDDCFKHISDQNGKFKAYIESLELDPKKRHAQMVEAINDFLLPGGYHLLLRPLPDGKISLAFREIEETYHMEVKDSEDSAQVPIIELGHPLFSLNKERMGSTLSVSLEYALIFRDHDESEANIFLNRNKIPLPRYNTNLSKAKLTAKLREGSVRHEATHVFLGRKFPKTGLIDDENIAFSVPLEFSIRTMNMPMHGVYPPVMFQELCAVGAEMATNEMDNAFVHHKWVGRPVAYPVPYKLVGKITPLATIKSAPSHPSKEDILEKLSRGDIHPGPIQGMMGQNWYSLSNARMAGAIMYRIGIDFFKKAEQGKLERVTNPNSKQ